MILVTGGAGFIGSNLVAALSERGAGPIAVCDRLDDADKARNLAKRSLADLFDPDRLMDWIEAHSGRIEAILHMGAISSTTATDAELVERVNVRLPMALWTWCARNGVKLIYASSAATYGDGSQGFDDAFSATDLARLRPLNLYGRSKLAFDRAVERLLTEQGPRPPQWAGLRFFNVYGPNEYHKGGQISVVLKNWREATRNGHAVLFRSHNAAYPDGGQKRDFVWVGDCAEVVLWLLARPDVSGLFNVGTGRARSFADLANAVFRAMGREPRIEYVDTPEAIRDKYQYFTEARMERLRGAGYERAFTPLEDGVATYVRDYLQSDDPYR
jgi:ADP-L-glycero-D-manno-heptose 6-epimerase